MLQFTTNVENFINNHIGWQSNPITQPLRWEGMMNKENITEALKRLRTNAPKREFSQSVELVINLKGLDLKKPDQQVELYIPLPHSRGKETKIGALVGPELAEQAKKACDTAVIQDQFTQYDGNKKNIKKLAKTHSFFIAQANIMPAVAKTFGRYLGPLNKMPNPKAGCVVPPNANLTALVEKLKKTIKVVAKVQPSIKVLIGTQKIEDTQIADNIMAIVNTLVPSLPQEKNNIKNIQIKYSMSPPVTVTDKGVKGLEAAQ